MARQVFLIPLLALAGAASAEVTRARYVMGTLLTVSVDGAGAEEAVEAVFTEVERWDRLLSTYKPDSEVSRLNAAAPGPAEISTDTAAALAAALDWSRRTEGAFDPLAGPGRTGGAAAVALSGGRARLPAKGMALDFGGIGKGWALDRALERLDRSLLDAVSMDFGGQWLFWSRDGRSRWPVALRDEEDVFSAPDGSVSTSAQSEKAGHIVDPRTGRPAGGLKSVTVWAPSATAADALSTALFVMGPRRGAVWAARESVAAILIDEEGRRTATPAWKEKIQ